MAFTERSARSRSAILAAAQRRFATDGYERTTIRAIATDAGIDPSMIIRYFGSKASLYDAASDIQLAAVDIDEGSQLPARYVESLLARWEEGENAAEAALLRTAPTHPDAAARVEAIFKEQIVPACRAAFPDDPDIEQRAALLLTQTLGLVYCRYLLDLEPVRSMDLDVITRAVTRAVEGHLTGDLVRKRAKSRRRSGA